jgi:hypothetical protein
MGMHYANISCSRRTGMPVTQPLCPSCEEIPIPRRDRNGHTGLLIPIAWYWSHLEELNLDKFINESFGVGHPFLNEQDFAAEDIFESQDPSK